MISFLFTDSSNVKENCRIRWTDKTGSYSEKNGWCPCEVLNENFSSLINKFNKRLILFADSFDGALGLVQAGEADIFLRPTTQLIDSDNKFDFSMPLISEEFHPFQAIESHLNQPDPQTLIEFIDSTLPSREFLALHLLGVLVNSLALFALFSIYSGRLKLKNFTKLLSFDSKHAPFRLLLLAYLVSAFLTEQLISNHINTTKVVVPTEYLIADQAKALSANRETCFFENSYEMIFYRTAPTNTLIHKLYEKRNRTDLCVLTDNGQIGNAVKRDTDKVFVIFTSLYFEINSKVLQTIVGKNGFLGEKLFENLRYFILRKRLSPAIKKFIDSCVYAHTSFGFNLKAVNAPASNFDLEVSANLRTYFSLNEYIEAYTVIRPLNFGDLSAVFRAYIGLQFTIVAVCLLYHLAFARWFPVRQLISSL